jgi:hypothetical protein
VIQDYDEALVPMFTFGFHLYIWNPNNIPGVEELVYLVKSYKK